MGLRRTAPVLSVAVEFSNVMVWWRWKAVWCDLILILDFLASLVCGSGYLTGFPVCGRENVSCRNFFNSFFKFAAFVKGLVWALDCWKLSKGQRTDWNAFLLSCVCCQRKHCRNQPVGFLSGECRGGFSATVTSWWFILFQRVDVLQSVPDARRSISWVCCIAACVNRLGYWGALLVY